MVVPTDVIEIYEHAFYVDYQNRKTDYVEKFIDIRWLDGPIQPDSSETSPKSSPQTFSGTNSMC